MPLCRWAFSPPYATLSGVEFVEINSNITSLTPAVSVKDRATRPWAQQEILRPWSYIGIDDPSPITVKIAATAYPFQYNAPMVFISCTPCYHHSLYTLSKK